jgi:A/G-specific adenine glycosylase
MTPTSAQRQQFSDALLSWYAREARDLPWRRTHDPYAILVSELMLQQTQVDRVLPKYDAWMKRFPDLGTLSRARTKTILSHWQGLGYNRRALYLQRIAKTVTQELDGVFPHTREGLLALPGIGPYTAGAIMSFAYQADEPIVDTNVERVVGRIFLGYDQLKDIPEKTLWTLATALLPKKGKTYDFNQALMDFGAMVCQARKPQCEKCPMQKQCNSYPAILDAKPDQLRYKKKAVERQYFGHPRRIWRGKILKYVHDNGSASLMTIGEAIQSDFSEDRLPWLKEVVSTMQKDGLIRNENNTVTLP